MILTSDSNVIDLRYEDNITIDFADASYASGEHEVTIHSADADGDGVNIARSTLTICSLAMRMIRMSLHLQRTSMAITAGILNQAVTDGHQGGYDVLTSGYLGGFGGITYGDGTANNDLQIKYSGDAGDFTDKRDEIDRDASEMSVKAESVDHVMSTQDTWEAQVASNNGSGDFYVEVEGKKVNVYFDELDAAWKVDSTAFGVANNVTVNASMDAQISRPELRRPAVQSLTLPPSVRQDIFLNATETDIISLLQENDLEDVESGAAHNFSFYTTVGRECCG